MNASEHTAEHFASWHAYEPCPTCSLCAALLVGDDLRQQLLPEFADQIEAQPREW